MPGLFWIVPVAGVLTVLFVIWLARDVLSRDTGTPKMKEIGDIIFQGAWAFLKRQYTTIGMYSVAIAVIIGVIVAAPITRMSRSRRSYPGFWWKTLA